MSVTVKALNLLTETEKILAVLPAGARAVGIVNGQLIYTLPEKEEAKEGAGVPGRRPGPAKKTKQ